ncbi:MAG: 23S rRNA (adenine(1618)-N(6))-methyltransferase RlmF [Saprospiraceae bacterium]
MPQKEKEHPPEKPKLHPRNRHRERYDFERLVVTCPELSPFVLPNIHGDESIDFANPDAVRTLNTALLKQYYNLEHWDIPENYLCPPIPGRADYIHHIADLLARHNYGKVPTGASVKCLDVGVGANCIYPIIGNKEYGWSFIGSDIDPVSIESANRIIEANPFLKAAVECRLQPNPKDIFYGIIQKDEMIDLTICNPPFHASLEDAQAATLRKLSNLQQEKVTTPTLNFGGQNGELWCDGGEEKFVRAMVRQSRQFIHSCFWFSSLISKKTHLQGVYEELKKAKANGVTTIPMGQGNKSSRIVAWTFLNNEQQKTWRNARWNAPAAPKTSNQITSPMPTSAAFARTAKRR